LPLYFYSQPRARADSIYVAIFVNEKVLTEFLSSEKNFFSFPFFVKKRKQEKRERENHT
jgi:hypothetical protein